MQRLMTFTALEDYFQSLAEKHLEIKDFCGTSKTELANKIGSHNGIETPILILFSVSSALSGNEQRTFNTREIAFAVVYVMNDFNDIEKVKENKTLAEGIGLDILSRINIESKMPEKEWLYNNFLKETVRYNEFEMQESIGLCGMEFFFSLKLPEKLTVDKEVWTDGDTFC